MLQGKVAIVTGGASGIGRAVCTRFSAEGASVAVVDVDETSGNEFLKELASPSMKFYKCDAGDSECVKSTVSRVMGDFGRIDVLVNNAVRFEFGHLLPKGMGSGKGTDLEVDDAAWGRVLRVNVQGYANFIKYCGEAMMKNDPTGDCHTTQLSAGESTIDARFSGAIVNVASVSGFIAQPEFVPYNCSKGAILQLTRCCAMDFARYKIRVNAVSPGTVETEGSHRHMKLLDVSIEEGRKLFSEGNLMKRQAAPQEVANVCLFLASRESSFMTGANIVVDGGSTIG